MPQDFVQLFDHLLALLVSEELVDHKFHAAEFWEKWQKKFVNQGSRVSFNIVTIKLPRLVTNKFLYTNRTGRDRTRLLKEMMKSALWSVSNPRTSPSTWIWWRNGRLGHCRTNLKLTGPKPCNKRKLY